jgi:glycosyltransferase involved in cell wall biosynthesis
MISIAMATYNGERFLEKQLRSLSEQVRLPDEVVICDDASTDRTPEILAQFAKLAPFPVRVVINDRRLRWRQNFMKAASLCTSDYIAFCDQDDIWVPDKLSVVSRYLDRDRCILLQHGYRLIDDDGNSISDDIKYARSGPEALWRINFGFTQVFHRSLLEFSHLWESSVDIFAEGGHDGWIAFLASLYDETVIIDDVLVYYRQHSTNVVGFVHPASAVNIKRNLSAILSRFYDRGGEFQKKRQRMIGSMQCYAAAAVARGRVIEIILPQASEERARSLRAHLQYYRDLSSYQSQRLLTYLSASRTERLQAAYRNYRQGLYQAQGRRGARDAIADFVYGVAN